MAMSHGAKLLILDEPTSALDPVARDGLLDILREYVADGEKSVFFSTHITSDLERIADYITLIDHGRILYTGTKDSLLEHFCIVKGNKSDLTDLLKRNLIGLSVTSAGFAGMLPLYLVVLAVMLITRKSNYLNNLSQFINFFNNRTYLAPIFGILCGLLLMTVSALIANLIYTRKEI